MWKILANKPNKKVRLGRFVYLSMMKQTIIINGNNISDLESFFVEIDRVLTKNLSWKTGHNVNAFNDLLRGGFGVYEYEEPVHIIWKNFLNSEYGLGSELASDLKKVILTHHHILLTVEN
jgi:RNAse (barnase) inhibitor barstar